MLFLHRMALPGAVFIASITVSVSLASALIHGISALVPMLLAASAAASIHAGVAWFAHKQSRARGLILAKIRVWRGSRPSSLVASSTLGAATGLALATANVTHLVEIAHGGHVLMPVAWMYAVARHAITQIETARSEPSRAAIISMLLARRNGRTEGA